MAVGFNTIPANLRVPLFYVELDNSLAATSQQQLQNALLLGTVPTAAPIGKGVPTLVFSADQVRNLCGVSSALGRQAERWFQNNVSVPLYILAIAEDASYDAAEGSVTWAGPATGSGTIPLYIGGRRCPVTVTHGMTAANIALAARDAINANVRLGVSAAVDTTPGTGTPTVTDITALQLGVLGGLSISIGLADVIGGETMPPGVTATIAAMAGAAGTPDVSAMLAGLGDAPFDFVMCPYNRLVDLTDLDDFFNDVTGRWSWASQLYGHGFSALEGNVPTLSTFGRQRNGQHVSVMGYFNSPTPHDEWMAAYVGAAATSLVADPARPTQSLQMLGVWPPPSNDRFTRQERNVLYFDGIAASNVEDNANVRIDRLVTTYRVNQWGAPDNSYLDTETLYTLAFINRTFRNRILLKFPRHKLASDGTRFGVGQAIVTPRIAKAELLATYAQMEAQGIVENLEAFREHLIVERDTTDPNRLNVQMSPDVVNALRIFAVKNSFLLMAQAA